MTDVRKFAISVWRHKLLTLMVVVLVLGATAAFTFTSTPMYAAEALLRVEQHTVSIGEAQAALTVSQRLAQTYARIVTSRSVAERVVADLGSDYTVGEVTQALSAHQVEDLDLMQISAVSDSAERAAAIANAAAGALKGYVSELEADTRRETLVIVDLAVPPGEPFAPRPVLNLLAALIAGIVLGIVLSLVFELVQDRFTSEEELENTSGLPVVGSIPVLAQRRT